MKFRISTILWLTAVFASAIATFGPFGIFWALFVLAFWGVPSPKATLLERIVTVCIFLIFLALLFPAAMRSFESERVEHCRENLETIAGALQRYTSEEGAIPPQTQTESDDHSLYSWRTALLPYLGHDSVRDKYHMDKPFGDPANKDARCSFIPQYSCRNDLGSTGATTSYFAVVGPETAWGHLASGDRISDDPSRTILLMEQLGRGVAWSDPTDIEFDEAIALLTTALKNQGLHSIWGKSGFFDIQPPRARAEGFNVAFADGSARFVSVPLPRDLAIALLTANGGEHISDEEFSQLYRTEIDYPKIYAFTFFVLVSILPALRWFPVRSVAEVGMGILPSKRELPKPRDGPPEQASDRSSEGS